MFEELDNWAVESEEFLDLQEITLYRERESNPHGPSVQKILSLPWLPITTSLHPCITS